MHRARKARNAIKLKSVPPKSFPTGQSPPQGVDPASRTDGAPMRTGFLRRLVDRFGSKRLGAASRRVRQPRLAVTDAVKVDERRHLILVRRDNVEHLLMIGGPADILIEPNVVRGAEREPPVSSAPPGGKIEVARGGAKLGPWQRPSLMKDGLEELANLLGTGNKTGSKRLDMRPVQPVGSRA